MKRLIGLTLLACLSAGCDDKPRTSVEGDPVQAEPDPSATDTAAPSVTDTGSAPTSTGPVVPPSNDTTDVIEDSEADECKPTTCEAEEAECGVIPDGCGETLECGTCAEGQLCGFESDNKCAAPPACVGASSCAELGWECGVAVDDCGNTFDCAQEGLVCNELETCIGGADGKTACQVSIGGEDGCDVCDGVQDCTAAAQDTILTGRVITPGRLDTDAANQVGVPNAFVYILTNNDPALLPAFVDGVPAGETACDRCDGQALGPVLTGATTDSLGYYTLEGNVPVGVEFTLVVKVGRFRRAVQMVLPDTASCATTELDVLQTRLPRSMDDGLGVNIPRIAISTGDIDAMECVFEKMGVAHTEFNVPGDGSNPGRIHLYGTDGAEMPEGNPDEDTLHGDAARLSLYDMLVFDCQGQGFLDPPAAAGLDNVRDYVNRGGRMFASHLSYQWICRNGDVPYAEETSVDTGLAPSGDFPGCEDSPLELDETGVGLVSIGRPGANPEKIEGFASWLENENAAAVNADGLYEFTILQPRNLANGVGEFSEEFVYRGDADSVQQYSFNTPYGSPAEAACGRVAYSGFHVSASDGNTAQPQPDPDSDAGAPAGGGGGGGGGGGTNLQPFANAVFPEHCAGDLTAQEKVLLFMLFDLGACVGDPPEPPTCDPVACEDVGAECGLINDGCGTAVDCGPCPPGEVCGLVEPNKCAACEPRTCDEVEIECGTTGDGCGGSITCECPGGAPCGLLGPNKCGSPDIAN